MNGLRASELAPEWRRSFSHFMTTEGWEVLPPILRSEPLAVVTTAKRLASCLDGKPSQLPNLGSFSSAVFRGVSVKCPLGARLSVIKILSRLNRLIFKMKIVTP
jgi:hypothetical protein